MNKHHFRLPHYAASMLLFGISLVASGLNVAHAGVADFALGEKNICIVDTDGTLDCTTDDNPRLYLPTDTGSQYLKVASGGAHSCAITQQGDIDCWGTNNFGQLDAPVSSSPFVAISASEAHSCALDAAGQVACWGLNNNGQTDVPADNADFVAIYTGTTGSCGTKTSLFTVCWSNTWPYTAINDQDGIIALQLPQRGSGDSSCAVYDSGSYRCFLNYDALPALDEGPYIKVRSNEVMICGLKPDGDLDCNLRNRDFAQTADNIQMLADIEALPPLVDFDTRFEFKYVMSLCGVDTNQQLHCLGSSLPAQRVPGEIADLPVPTNLSISVYGDNVAELLWNIDLSGIRGEQGQFRVYRNGEMINQGFGSASHLDRTFQLGVPYVYEVSYVASDGMEGPRSEALSVNGEFNNTDTDEVIGVPSGDSTLNGVEVSRYGAGALEIFWDSPSQAPRQYDVYRNGELVASVPGASYFDNQINTTSAYQYTIVAISDNGAIQAVGFAQMNNAYETLQCF